MGVDSTGEETGEEPVSTGGKSGSDSWLAESLSNRAHSGRDGNGNGSDSGRAGRAVGDVGTAAGDRMNRCGEDGGGGDVAGH